MKLAISSIMIVFASALFANETQQIEMKNIGFNTFYISSKINGAGETSLLVDTGSGYSIINRNTLAQLLENGDATYLHELEGIMADGSQRIVSVYRISGMTLGNNCYVPNIDVVVFPSGTRQILGLSTLSKVAPFTFSTNPPQLSLSHCGQA